MATVGKTIGTGAAMCGLGLVAVAVGLIFGALILAVSKTPWMTEWLTALAFLGFALAEAMGLIIVLFTLITLFV